MQRWADLLVEELVRCGIDRATIGPGSRSTPLVTACARNPDMRIELHVDERAAAFFALGLARATGRPGLWITTSGTAAANGLPAVAEASVDGVPLLMVTADRPPELRDTAANQTIRQTSLFDPFVRWKVDMPVPDNAVDPAYVLTTVDQAVYRATGTDPGPVHVNAMFRKPLEPLGAPVTGDTDPARRGRERGPYTRYAGTSVRPDTGPLIEALERVRRPVILAGRLSVAEARAVEDLADRTGWPVVADILSQMRLGPGEAVRHGELLAPHADGLPLPDAVVEVGRPGVSTGLRSLFLGARPTVHAVLAAGPARIDPSHGATHRLQGSVEALVALSAHGFTGKGAWGSSWTEADRRIALGLEARLAGGELSEYSVAWHLGTMITSEHALFAASSLPIRHLDVCAGPGVRPTLVAANRGASGIDGTVASAAGLCDGLDRPVTLVVGDLALLHDLNALALLRDRPVTAVVLNNDGGGIFSFLPIASHADVFEPWFAAPHGLTFRSAAEMFGLAYQAPTDVESFREAYRSASASATGSIIEVASDRERTRALFDELQRDAGRQVAGS